MPAFWGILAGVFAGDWAVKRWADAALKGRAGWVVIPRVLELRYSRNRGMALGILSENAWAALTLPVIAVAVWLLVFRKYRITSFTSCASALLLGGFAGNFANRLLLGYVVDMIYFPFLPWFICNPADIAICAGALMLGASLLLRPQDWREKHAKDDGPGAP